MRTKYPTKATLLLLAGLLASVLAAPAQAPYQPTWESLDRHKIPAWYDDAKIGLSMHWGIYAVPAWAPRDVEVPYAEWYGARMDEPGNPTHDYHLKTYGTNHPYDRFIPQWKAESYDPAEWARFAKRMGAKYMFITSKHHDGFCLWPTKYTDRNVKQMGPRKDILGPYFKAARKEGLKVGLYYSLFEWHNPLYTGKEVPYAGLKRVNNYVDDFMIPQLNSTKLRKVKINLSISLRSSRFVQRTIIPIFSY